MISFNLKNATKELLQHLPDRSRKVLSDRYGLTSKGDERTLDAIGKEYGITRERVRQIENHGLSTLRQSEVYARHRNNWTALKRLIEDMGDIVPERHFLPAVAKNDNEQRHLVFLLTVGEHFEPRREDDHFVMRWATDTVTADKVEAALRKLHDSIQPDKLYSDADFTQLFLQALKEQGIKPKLNEHIQRYLSLSKKVAKNPLGEWGSTQSSQVKIRNTRDYAYLTLKRHGSPMHFIEVAKNIDDLFKRKTHPATTHNELIKDKRFVLVGRGLYALKEWGYAPGIVKDVIRAIIEREGPLTREEIIDRVKRERYVKDATIVVNLQNGIFSRREDGKYVLAAQN